jgi:hypothetical protein
LGPLGTAASNRPIAPAPGDYNDEEIGGMLMSGGNRNTWRKPSSVPLYLLSFLFTYLLKEPEGSSPCSQEPSNRGFL